MVFFFFKQKTAYEMRISDWSSDVCSSDLPDAVDDGLSASGGDVAGQGPASPGRRAEHRLPVIAVDFAVHQVHRGSADEAGDEEIGRASCRERVCQYV